VSRETKVGTWAGWVSVSAVRSAFLRAAIALSRQGALRTNIIARAGGVAGVCFVVPEAQANLPIPA
jgi:hypothetical protein